MVQTWNQVCPTSPRHRYVGPFIETEGVGITRPGPEWEPILRRVWATWGGLIGPAAAKVGIPPAWATAIMTNETKGVNYGANAAGAGGLMGLLPGTASEVLGRHITAEGLTDPATNVAAGVGYMANLAKRYGTDFPAIAGSYNAGSVRCSESTRCKGGPDWSYDGTTATNSWGMVEDCSAGKGSGYVARAVSFVNALNDLGVAGSTGGSFGKVMVLLAVGGAGYLATRALLGDH